MKNGSNYIVSKYWTRRGRSISKFWVISLFQHRCSARDGKQITITISMTKMNRQFHRRNANDNSLIKKAKSDLSVWSHWLPSTEKNDFNWFRKGNKCSNMTLLQFIAPKELTTKVYNTKCGSTDLSRDEEMFALFTLHVQYVDARVRKWRENEAMRALNSQSQSQMNEPVFYWYWNNEVLRFL